MLSEVSKFPRLSRLSVVAIGAALIVSACSSVNSATDSGSSSAGPAPTFKAKAADKITVGYASPIASQPPQQQVYNGFAQAAKSLGWTPELLDSNLSANTQVSNIQTMIQQNVGAIASATLDPGATAGVYTRAEAAGIPIIGMSSTGTGIAATVWFEPNTCNPGSPMEREAKEIARNKPGAKVIIITLTGVPSIDGMTNCFANAAQAAGLTILDRASNTTDNASGAAKLSADLLTKYPDVDAFWDYNDASAEGVSSAVLASGKKIMSKPGSEGLQVWGNSADADGITALKQGRITATLDLNTLAEGWATVKMIRDLLNGVKTSSIVVSSTIVDSSNIGSYVDPLQRNITFDTIPTVSS